MAAEPEAIDVNGLTYTPGALRQYASAVARAHDPQHQDGNTYKRCALCSYTHHPCDTFDMASAVLALLDSHGSD